MPPPIVMLTMLAASAKVPIDRTRVESEDTGADTNTTDPWYNPDMRIAALYDIHGNLPALEAVIDDVASTAVDAIVIGGDVLPGPMPRETMERVRTLAPHVQAWRVWEDTLLVVQIDRVERDLGRRVLEPLVKTRGTSHLKMIAVVSPDVNLDDEVDTIWGIFTRFDPAREAFEIVPLPTRDGIVRHVWIDGRTGDVWGAYGSFPTRSQKVFRIRAR